MKISSPHAPIRCPYGSTHSDRGKSARNRLLFRSGPGRIDRNHGAYCSFVRLHRLCHSSRYAGVGGHYSGHGHGAMKLKPRMNGLMILKSPSSVINVVPLSLHVPAIRISLTRERGLSLNATPSCRNNAASIRPQSLNTFTDGPRTRPRRSNTPKIPRSSARAAVSVTAPARNSCMTTALMKVTGALRSRKASKASSLSGSRMAPIYKFVSRTNLRVMETAALSPDRYLSTRPPLALAEYRGRSHCAGQSHRARHRRFRSR